MVNVGSSYRLTPPLLLCLLSTRNVPRAGFVWILVVAGGHHEFSSPTGKYPLHRSPFRIVLLFVFFSASTPPPNVKLTALKTLGIDDPRVGAPKQKRITNDEFRSCM